VQNDKLLDLFQFQLSLESIKLPMVEFYMDALGQGSHVGCSVSKAAI
jgi:hypothetical protein